MIIEKGRRNNKLLVQPQYSPMPVAEQIAVLYCGVHNLLSKVPLDKIPEFESLFIDIMHSRYKESVLNVLASGEINDDVTAIIERIANEITATLN